MLVLADGTHVDTESGDIYTVDDIKALIAQVAQQEGIPPEVALAVAQQESGFNVMAVGDGGHSHGLFQENDQGRGYGRAPDYDITGQVQRFAAEYRNAAAANPGADAPTLAYLAQRPADREGYINSIAGILGVSGGGGNRLAAPMPDAFKPKGPIKSVQIFGNQVQVTYSDDAITPDLVDLASWEAFTGVRYDPTTGKPAKDQPAASGPAPITPYQQASLGQAGSQFNQNLGLNYAQLTEQQRQFNENQGVDKAKFNITQQFNEAVQKWREAVDSRDYEAAQFWAQRADQFKVQQTEAENANRDVTRGQTLLGLGSRPETLGRYLYALQGQQVPQGFDFGTSALPGFGPNAANPTVGPLGGSAAPAGGGVPGAGQPALTAPAGAAPAVDPTLAFKNALADPMANLQPFFGDAPTTITRQNPNIAPVTLTPQSTGIPSGPTAEQISAQNDLITQGRVPKFYSNGVAIFGEGGPVNEPVLGHGLLSGLPYMIGEKGPETIVPEGKTLAQVKGKKQKGRKFATGGTLGLTPQQQAEIQAAIAASATWNAQQKPYVAPTTPAPGQSVISAPLAPSPVTAPASIGGNPTQATTAMIGGVLTWAGGPYSGQPVASTPANAGNLTPYLRNPSLPAPIGATAPSPIPNPAIANTVTTPAAGSLPGLPNIPGNTGGMRGAATVGRSVFNPGQLGDYLGGQFLRPGIPNFPQYQQATGGTSLLSNARWLNNATPTERGLFEGFQRDEAGIMPEDALALAGRMAPRGGALRTPGYGRTY